MTTHAGKTVYIAADLDPSADLADLAAFEGLTWVEVKGCGAFPELGRNEPIATYNTFERVEKGKGVPDFGGGDMEVKRISGDAGQAALRAAGSKTVHAGFKVVYKDATGTANGDYSATTDYAKGVVTGPRRGSGTDEDFILDIYTLGFTQVITDEPAEIST